MSALCCDPYCQKNFDSVGLWQDKPQHNWAADCARITVVALREQAGRLAVSADALLGDAHEPTAAGWQALAETLAPFRDAHGEIASSPSLSALHMAREDVMRLAGALPEVLCKSGKFETGQGTCAVICMDQLGSARKHCVHRDEVFAWAVEALAARKHVEGSNAPGT